MELQELLKSTTNRLVLLNVLVFAMVSAITSAGGRSGLELYAWGSDEFQFWQLLSYMFLHADVYHLAFNMLALWSFGRVLERAWGGQRFLVYYLLCGLGAAVAHLAVSHYEFAALYQQLLDAGISSEKISSLLANGRYIPQDFSAFSAETLAQFYGLGTTPAVGASGAVYGILVAFAWLFPNFKVMLIFLPIPIAAKYFVPVLLLIDLTAGVTGIALFGRNIAHFAHLGGALTGFLLLQYWLRQLRD